MKIGVPADLEAQLVLGRERVFDDLLRLYGSIDESCLTSEAFLQLQPQIHDFRFRLAAPSRVGHGPALFLDRFFPGHESPEGSGARAIRSLRERPDLLNHRGVCSSDPARPTPAASRPTASRYVS